LRDRLQKLELVDPSSDTQAEGKAVLRYTGSCRNDGNLLRVEHIVLMLEQVSQLEVQILQVQRRQLILGYT